MLASVFVGCWLGLASLFVGELWLVLLAFLTAAAAFLGAYVAFSPYVPSPSRREVERSEVSRRARSEVALPAWINSANEAYKRRTRSTEKD
jgi:membrane protein implicated in regulation of membrane protease activity